MDGFRFVEGPIEVSDYLKLREAVGWPELDYDSAEAALANSLYSVNAVNQTEVVGCGRVVGDGRLYFYIHDVIVLPEYRGRGIENRIVELIMSHLKTRAKQGAFVGMMSAGRLSGFYVQNGFPDVGSSLPDVFGTWRDRIP